MFFRKKASYRTGGATGDDDSSSGSSSSDGGGEESTLFSTSFGTNDGTATNQSVAMTTAGDAACMRLEDMMFGLPGGSTATDEGDSWLSSRGTKSTGGSWSNPAQEKQNQQWARRFMKPQQQRKIAPDVSVSFESLVTNTVEKAGCMGFEWPSSSSDEDDDEDLGFDEDTVLSELASALIPQTFEEGSDGGVGRLIQSNRIKSNLRKKARKAEQARKAEEERQAAEPTRAMSPVMESWSAIRKTLSGGAAGSDESKRGAAAAATAAVAAGTALAVGTAASSGGLSQSDGQRRKGNKDKFKNVLHRSQSAPDISPETKLAETSNKSKFRSFWKRSKGGGYISDVQDDAELVPVETSRKKLPTKRPDTPIVPSATTISKSIRYHQTGQGKRKSGSNGKQTPRRQSPRQVKLNHAVMVYGADARQDAEEAPRATEAGKYVPSPALVRQMRCDDGRFSPTPTAAPTHLYLPKNHTEMPYKQQQQRHHMSSSGGKSVATRMTAGARTTATGRSGRSSTARTVASRRSSYYYDDGRSHYASSGKSVRTASSRKTRGERSVATRRSVSRKRGQSMPEEMDVLGFLSPGSMEA